MVLWSTALLTVPGLGLTDIVDSLLPASGPGKMFITAYALVVSIVLTATLLTQLFDPVCKVAWLRPISVAALAFGLTTALSGNVHDIFGFVVVVVMLGTVLAAHPARRLFLPRNYQFRALKSILAWLGSLAWLGLAVVTAAKQRAGLPPHEGFALGPDSWDAITLLGFSIGLNGFLAGLVTDNPKVFAMAAGAPSALFGVASLVRGGPGSLPVAWAIAATVWGLGMPWLFRARPDGQLAHEESKIDRTPPSRA